MPVFQKLVVSLHGVQPPGGATTVKFTVQVALFPAQSVTVTVTGCTPGNTMVPASGDCEQVSGPQTSVAHAFRSRQKSGTTFEQPVTVRGKSGLFCKHWQFSTGGVVSTTVTIWLHEARTPQPSRIVQVRVITRGQAPLVVVVTLMSVTPLPVVPCGGQQ